MKRRYQAAREYLSQFKFEPAYALRTAFRKGYSWKDVPADAMAGVVVGIVALPLAMALAIASGVAPQHGIYTAIVGGAVIALLGGSKVQVSGPTAAFVVVLAPIASTHGVGGLLIATLMAGVMLVALSLARAGRLIEFVPHPVTTGFTAGIAVVIATIQLKDFFGLTVARMPDHYLERVAALVRAAPTARLPDLLIGGATLAVLILWPRVTKRVPGPLVALNFATLLALALPLVWPGFEVATIASRFSYTADGVVHRGIPPFPPLPALPWNLPGADGHELHLSFGVLRSLVPSAFAIAMLGAIESLLCAVVADGMSGKKHDPDAELLGQGVGNIVVPFFGGIAATGAIARTATSIRAGARSPLAAIFHALFVLAGVVALAPALGYLPMASLAALLLVVAYNMSEVKHFAHIVRVAPKSDVTVLLTCFTLTVVFDMVVSVTTGVLLAAVLFMRRMADISHTRLLTEEHHEVKDWLPRGVTLYEIRGPLFFGAAQKAISAIGTAAGPGKTVILNMTSVPAMDVTGLVALESALAKLRAAKAVVYVAGIQEQPRNVLRRAGMENRPGELMLFASVEEAIAQIKGAAPSLPAPTT